MTRPAEPLNGLDPHAVSVDQGWSPYVVGVVGGLGPLATAAFLDIIVKLTPATRDQEHLDLIVLDHSTTPDRTAFILDPESAPDPAPSLVADARRLASWGASVVVMPCNTASHYLTPERAAVDVPLVSIVDVTAAEAVSRSRSNGATDPVVGVLATAGTRACGVYDRAIEAAGGSALWPDDADQAVVMSIIYDQVKGGQPLDLPAFEGVIARMREAGADVVALACTELSVVYAEQRMHGRAELVDSMDALARATIQGAGRTPNAHP